jgi:hypothetical protein
MKYVTDISKRVDPLTVVMNRERRIIYSDAGTTPEQRIYEQLISILKRKRFE